MTTCTVKLVNIAPEDLMREKQNELANIYKKRATPVALLVTEHDLIFVSKAI